MSPSSRPARTHTSTAKSNAHGAATLTQTHDQHTNAERERERERERETHTHVVSVLMRCTQEMTRIVQIHVCEREGKGERGRVALCESVCV